MDARLSFIESLHNLNTAQIAERRLLNCFMALLCPPTIVNTQLSQTKLLIFSRKPMTIARPSENEHWSEALDAVAEWHCVFFFFQAMALSESFVAGKGNARALNIGKATKITEGSTSNGGTRRPNTPSS